MTEPWPLHTVVFDLDDTLYPEREYVLSGFAAVDAWLRKERGVTGFAVKAGELFQRGHRGRIFDEVLPLLGLEAAAELIGAMLRVYREHAPRIALFPDADEALRRMGREFNLALISDGYAGVQERKIKALGLEEKIPFRIVTDTLGREFWKPHPESFRRVMARFPGPAGGFVYVSDNPRKDFIGPRQLGWHTVRIRRPGGEHADYVASAAEAAEREIVSLAELTTFIAPAGEFR